MGFDGLPRVAVNNLGIANLFYPILCFGNQSYSPAVLTSSKDWTEGRGRMSLEHQGLQELRAVGAAWAELGPSGSNCSSLGNARRSVASLVRTACEPQANHNAANGEFLSGNHDLQTTRSSAQTPGMRTRECSG